jgi:hypothetical protein
MLSARGLQSAEDMEVASKHKTPCSYFDVCKAFVREKTRDNS